jgi:hypothetical protein
MEQSLAFELCGACEAKLGLDVLPVRTDGLGRQAKFGSNVARGPAGANQQEDLHFPIGQLRIAFAGRPAKAAREQARIHACRDSDIAQQHCLEGINRSSIASPFIK